MNPIVLHPGLPQEKVGREDVLECKSGPDVYEPSDRDKVESTLKSLEDPVAFVCANGTWSDRYLKVLTDRDWVTTVGAGYDAYPVETFRERGILFTNTPGIHDRPIGEFVFGLLFCLSRGLFRYYRQQRETVWEKHRDTTDYAGETCCIIGLGWIGEELARRARAFDMHVRGVKRSVEGYDGAAHEVYPSEELKSALEGAQIVIAAVPLTPATEGLLNAESLSLCSDDAVVVNISRGPVVDTDGLLSLLDANELEAALLDVFDTEPLPPESPLWDRDNVIITPHAAATTDKGPRRFLDVFVAQYERWLAGEELEHVLAP